MKAKTKTKDYRPTHDSVLWSKLAYFELQSQIEALEKDNSLYLDHFFEQRVDAIEFIDFQLFHQLEEHLSLSRQQTKFFRLRQRVEKIKSALEDINRAITYRLQEKIRTEGCRGKVLKQLIRHYVPHNGRLNQTQEDPGYDNLDILINELCFYQSMPNQTKELEEDMVYYQKTPARMVFDLVEKSELTSKDVFFDLGSGLGQVAILVNLLSGAESIGVEIDPAFCEYAKNCATNLHLSEVTFIHQDARNADYSKGTVFFLFTPFKGELLNEVLEKLRRQSLQRRIKIITYGPCTVQIALASWLFSANPRDKSIYTLGVFYSNTHV